MTTQVITYEDHGKILKAKMARMGLMKPTPWFYISRTVFIAVLVAACAYALATSPPASIYLPIGIGLALLYTSLGYLAHDLGHRQVFKGRGQVPRNDRGMQFICCLVGIGPSWWREAHNGHHAFPNDEVRDPNYRVAVLAFSEAQFEAKTPFLKVICRWQHIWYPVGIALEPFLMRIHSVGYLRARKRYWISESICMGMYFVSHFGFLIWALGIPGAIIFTLVHQSFLGLCLGAAFAPNHKGMRVIKADEKVSYLEQQLTTARNIIPGFWSNFLLGGLDYQIEHHIFPDMPRPNLRRARNIIKRYCEENGLPYYETELLASYLEIFNFFKTAGRGKPEEIDLTRELVQVA